MIEGTAGIGKSRLLAEAAAQAAGGMRVLSARGGELEGDFAFGVVRQLFEPLLATAPPAPRAELFAGAATLAEPLFDAASLVDAAGGEADASFAMLARPLLARGERRVRAADGARDRRPALGRQPSLRWLCYLARRLEGLPLLVAVAMRPPEQGRDPELLTELLTDPAATAIRPRAAHGRLDRGARAAAVRATRPTPEFCAAVEAATRGNPLFVLALLDTVAREGIEPRADQAHVLLELGPLVVGRAVALRLARLPEDATALLEAAAILGDGTELRHVAALAGLEPAPAAHAAQQLVRSDLLDRDDPVEFFHPVVRTAIYEGLDALARSEGHRRAAGLLVEAGAPPEQAAAHLLATVAGRRSVRRRDAARGGAPLARPGRRRTPPPATSRARSRGARRAGARRGARRARAREAADRRPGGRRAPRRGARAPHRPGAPRRRRARARERALLHEPDPGGDRRLPARARRRSRRTTRPTCTSGSRPS